MDFCEGINLNYSDVQKIAKDTIEFAKKNIHSGMSLIEVRELCEHKLIELGADSFWYWNIGAFVFAGDETAISVSGKKYSTSVTPDTTFEELYFYINGLIEQSGYVNIDFMGNLGHSIVKKKDERIYIEKGNHSRLGDVSYFTFEPHISLKNSKYGYKRENIYYFEKDKLKEL